VNRRTIRPGMWWLGAIDWDRRLFDELIPLPDGTSYNAYLVVGSAGTALIDTCDPTRTAQLLRQLAEGPDPDVVVIQHVEQDHSGSLPAVAERYPDARILCSPKAHSMLVEHLGVDEQRIEPVEDGETLSLGDRTLEFLHAPWVHWPETMLTYLREDRTLLTCDLFGSHLATSSLCSSSEERLYAAAKRYYAEIMMPFATSIKGHLERLQSYDVEMIAPSHGPIHDRPSTIVDAYRRWVLDPPGNRVCLPHTSMHGSTALMVDHLIAALVERDVGVAAFDMASPDLGAYAAALVDAATVVFATPTVLAGAHPNVAHAAMLTAALRPKLRHAAVIGSYGWAGRASDQIQSLCGNLKVEWHDAVFARGLPTEETMAQLDRLAADIAERHRELE